MAKSSGGAGRGGEFAYPKAPAGVSSLVRGAYTGSLSPNRVGLTAADKRALARGVKAGNLSYIRDVMGWRYWVPVVTVKKTGARVALGNT